MRILVLGYGNPGRLDDGLGPALAEALGERALPGVTVDADYQLHVEYAAELAQHDVVVFADADVSCRPPFRFERLEPVDEVSFSSHSLRPAAVLGAARTLFGATCDAYVLGIRGYKFNEFGEGLSRDAASNLSTALDFLVEVIQGKSFADRAADGSDDRTHGPLSTEED